jgi:hypothetical protein
LSPCDLSKETPNQFDSEVTKECLDLVDWKWITDDAIDLSRAFGPLIEAQPFVVEPKGQIDLPIFLSFRPNWRPQELRRYIEIDVEMVAAAINPKDGLPIPGSIKTKRFGFRGTVSTNGPLVPFREVDTNG